MELADTFILDDFSKLLHTFGEVYKSLLNVLEYLWFLWKRCLLIDFNPILFETILSDFSFRQFLEKIGREAEF